MKFKILFAILSDEEKRKKLIKTALITVGLVILLPAVLLIALLNGEGEDDLYIKAQQEIVKEKDVYVDIVLARAIDSELFYKKNEKTYKSIKRRLDKYYYKNVDMDFPEMTEINKKEYDKLSEEINKQPENERLQAMSIDGKYYKMEITTKNVNSPNSTEEIFYLMKKDGIEISEKVEKLILDMYQFAMQNSYGINGLDFGNIQEINPNMTQQQFIQAILPGALVGYSKYQVFPSVSIAQAILESGWGKSGLAIQGKNLFGIKAIGKWNGPSITMPTKEYYGGKVYHVMAAFRMYPSWAASVEDHGKFLKENPRYTKHGVFAAKNCVQQVMAIHKAGYATSSDYTRDVVGVIKKYGLERYDFGGSTSGSVNIPNTGVSGSVANLLNYARRFKGVPYVWGGTTPAGFDCSGFTSYVYKNVAGITIPRTSREQAKIGQYIGSKTSLQPGDLVFFGNPTGHVGIYTGNGNYIHSPRKGDVVKEVPMNRKDFTHGRRILSNTKSIGLKSAS